MNDGIVLAPKVLEVDNLSVSYFTPRGAVIAANKVNFYIRKGEIVGLVGESGCGKTTVAMSILQMVQSPGKIVGGEVRINGRNIIGMERAAATQDPLARAGSRAARRHELAQPGAADQGADGRFHPGA